MALFLCIGRSSGKGLQPLGIHWRRIPKLMWRRGLALPLPRKPCNAPPFLPNHDPTLMELATGTPYIASGTG